MFRNFWRYYRSLDSTKKLFWLYLFLIFLEGAMRKWLMPNMSNLWMMSRDPIVIWTVLSMLGSRYLRSKVAIAFMAIAVIMFLTTLTMGHGNLYVALFGFRIWFLHIPYMFIMANKLNREDLMRVGQFLIFMFMPMTVLYVMQWAAPANAWINAQAGGILFDGETVAYGAVRPAGLFAHGKGAAYYNPLVVTLFVATCFSMYYRRYLLPIRRGFLILSVAVVTMLICSMSRGTVIQSALTFILIALMLSLTGKARYFLHILFASIVLYAIFTVLADVSIDGKNLMEPITARFVDATATEGGTSGVIDGRILEPYRFWNDKGQLLDPPFFGYGIGAGSNFGTQMLGLHVGQNATSEAWGLGEWSSQIVTNEMGFLFGGMVFFLRIGLCVYLFFKSIKCLRRNNDVLPFCLWTLCVQYFANGDLNLAMTLGWVAIVMIMLMASIRLSIRIRK